MLPNRWPVYPRGFPTYRVNPAARPQQGFTLTEIAVVLLIIGLLLGGMMLTYTAQVDQSNRQETQRRLEYARELLIGFAIVNGRLPCPASAASSDESPSGGGTCTDYYTGYLPGSTIGFQPVDAAGYAVDAWNNRIRYAVSAKTWGTTPFARFTKTHVPSDATAAWDISQTPNDLVICVTAVGTTTSACNTAVSVTNQNVLVAVVWTLGKNAAGDTSARPDENANNKTATNSNHPVFVYRPTTGIDTALGEFDDQMAWLPASQLYSRLISAGVLP